MMWDACPQQTPRGVRYVHNPPPPGGAGLGPSAYQPSHFFSLENGQFRPPGVFGAGGGGCQSTPHPQIQPLPQALSTHSTPRGIPWTFLKKKPPPQWCGPQQRTSAKWVRCASACPILYYTQPPKRLFRPRKSFPQPRVKPKPTPKMSEMCKDFPGGRCRCCGAGLPLEAWAPPSPSSGGQSTPAGAPCRTAGQPASWDRQKINSWGDAGYRFLNSGTVWVVDSSNPKQNCRQDH